MLEMKEKRIEGLELEVSRLDAELTRAQELAVKETRETVQGADGDKEKRWLKEKVSVAVELNTSRYEHPYGFPLRSALRTNPWCSLLGESICDASLACGVLIVTMYVI